MQPSWGPPQFPLSALGSRTWPRCKSCRPREARMGVSCRHEDLLHDMLRCPLAQRAELHGLPSSWTESYNNIYQMAPVSAVQQSDRDPCLQAKTEAKMRASRLLTARNILVKKCQGNKRSRRISKGVVNWRFKGSARNRCRCRRFCLRS